MCNRSMQYVHIYIVYSIGFSNNNHETKNNENRRMSLQ